MPTKRKRTTKQRRGAQPANVNAERHGVYSSRLTADEYKRFVDGATGALDLADEIGVARVALDRILARMRKCSKRDFHGLRRAADEQLGRIGHLMRQQKSLLGGSSPLESLVNDILDGVSEKLDVRL